MYIEPNSTVILLKDIPWNNNYEATMWFGDTIAQAYYFSQPSKIVATFNKQSYVRPSGSLGGTIEVRELADNLYNVNYMMFQNTNFGNKWFYAFVTGIEYVNNKNTKITFEIDVMQTWLIGTENTPNDYTLNECFVEREHSATDEIGDNLVDENLELGDYYFTDNGQMGGFDGAYSIIVASTFVDIIDNGDGTYLRVDISGRMYGGVYSGVYFNVFTSASDASDFLYKATNANYSDGIVAVFMIPSQYIQDATSTAPHSITDSIVKYYVDINGYIPKNNKLFTSPYNFLCVSDNNGNVANYPYEYFNSDRCNFKTTVALACTPEAQCVPMNFKGVQNENYNERMVISNFPQCAYTIDSYRAWLAQNAIPMTASVGSTIVGSVFSGAVSGGVGGAVVGGISSAIGSVSNALAQKHVASTMPLQARGSQTSVINMATKTQGFRSYRVQIRAEFAKIIDDFFQKYGYATKQVKIPNVNVREHWTYVKTIGCTISGSLPADDESTICSIFDSGITFFKDEASFKSQSSTINRPLSEVVVNG